MTTCKTLIVFILLPILLVSPFYIKIKEEDERVVPYQKGSSEDSSKAIEDSSDYPNIELSSAGNVADNDKCSDCEQVPFKICKTWAQDTFDILGHFLDAIMQLANQMDVCDDSPNQIVVSMWGDNTPVPVVNQQGETKCCK